MKEKSVIRPSFRKEWNMRKLRINNTNPLYNKKILNNRITMKKQAVEAEIQFQE